MSNLHQHSFVFDAHCDTLMAGTPGPQYRDLLQWGSTGHLDLPRLRAAGINCQVFACFPGRTRLNACATSAVLERIQVLYDWMERAPGQFLLVRTAADLASLTSDGPIGAILGLEGSEALAGSLSLLRIFHRLGVRNIGLTWDRRTAAADGVRVGSKAGLS
ncbi:MAG: membrane dipeptidase, partial [Chloroflexi bacterium]|nr:membrane dipeptidase [Chloroflexota bacterium]